MRTIKEIELDIESINYEIDKNIERRNRAIEKEKYYKSIIVNQKESLERLYSHLDEQEEILYNLKN